MSTVTSIPVSDPKRFLTLQDRYKQELMGDQRLEEASAVAARRQMLLENQQVAPEWALPQVKAISQKLNRLTRRIRQPFGTAPSSEDLDAEDTTDDFAAGPVQAIVKRLIQPFPAKPPPPIKETPANKRIRKRRLPTPVVTPTPRRPKKPATPLTGVNPLPTLDAADEEDEPPETFIDRHYQQSVLGVKRKATHQAKTAVKRKAKQKVAEEGARILGQWLQYK